MDKETLEIQHKIKLVGQLVDHEAWSIVETAFMDRINENSNLGSINVAKFTPEELHLELRAREISRQLISSWLNDIAGTAEIAKQNLPNVKESYIITKES